MSNNFYVGQADYIDVLNQLATKAEILNYSALVASGSGLFPDGTVSAPSISFAADTDTGIRRTGTNSLALVTGGSDRLTIDSAGTVSIAGNLTVNGSTTTINSTVLTVDDKNIELGSVTTPSNVTANGGGITLKGTTDKTIIWDSTNSNWTSSENWNLASGKVYNIAGTSVLNATTLGSGVTTSSLTSVGTVTTGTWSGLFGAVTGANLTNLTAGNLTGTIPSDVLANSTLYVGTTAIKLNKATANLSLTGISGITFPGATSGSVSLTPTAVAGAATAIVIPAISGTLALTSDIKTGTLTLNIGTAAASGTTITVPTGTGFNANVSTNQTYQISVGPALTALATLMSTAGAGFIRRGATADTYVIDTSTYLTSVIPSNFASQTANTVLAAPNAAAGAPTFRALVAADIPTLNQNTTGTAANVTGTVLIAKGGTSATTAAAALVNLGVLTGATNSIKIATGTTAQRDATPAAGYFRFNSTNTQFEGYDGTSWAGVGGASGAGGNPFVYENDITVTASYTITADKNAMSAGPIIIADAVSVTIPSGSVWTIV